jgi:hypothetical protein
VRTRTSGSEGGGEQTTARKRGTAARLRPYISILWRRLLKHGIFTSETDLAQQMLAYVETYNQTATPFKWTYTGKILEA